MTLVARIISAFQAVAADIKNLTARVSDVENKSEVFIDSQPEGNHAAISFAKVPGTNTYKMSVRVPDELV